MKKSKIIGVPLNYGANKCGIEYGLDNFFSYNSEYKSRIDIIPITRELEDFSLKNLKFLNTISKACNELAIKIDESIDRGEFPISIGGDHSIALGSIAGSSNKKRIGVLWVDAHGDFNTGETSESGHIHGMPLAVSCGYGDPKLVNCYHKGRKVDTENVVLFGQRSIDKLERKLMEESGVKCYEWSEIARRGFDTCLKEASDYLKSKGIDIHLSFDLDAIDPLEVTGVSTPVVDGLSRSEGLKLVDYMFKNHLIRSMDIVEYNPIFEKTDDTAQYMDQLLKRVEDNLEKYS